MAVNAISFNKRIPPGTGSRGTLAEMMARAKAAADARNTAMTTIETPTIMQGVGKLAQTLSAGLQERWARNEEQTGREELARIKAGIALEGATPEQLSQVGMYDPELEQQLREEAVQARRDAAARAEAVANREDTQVFTAGESSLERAAREKSEAAQRALTASEGQAGRDVTVSEGQAGREATSTLQDNRLRHEGEQNESATQVRSPAAREPRSQGHPGLHERQVRRTRQPRSHCKTRG